MELRIEVKDILSNRSQFFSFNQKSIKIGRNKSHDISIPNKYISDTHASLNIQDGSVYLKDERSSNGTEFYNAYHWHPLKTRKKKISLPAQIKLAEAVVLTIESGESRIISLSEIENDVAIMVLDICDSTNQSSKDEKIAFHLKQRLSQISKPLLYKSSVQFYKNTGDGFLATFPKTTQAANTAIKILKELEKRNKKTQNPPINVRIGLHKGRTYLIDPATEDIHGIDINITFRIEGLKASTIKQGHIKIPEINRILTTSEFYSDYQKKSRRKQQIIEYAGNAKLKGIRKKKEIYLINW